MTEKIDLYKTLMTPKQRSNLLSIYIDYQYIARQFQDLMQNISTKDLAGFTMRKMYKDAQDVIPWRLHRTTVQERKDYLNFIEENTPNDTGKVYISLQHTDPQRDYSTPISYIPNQYRLTTMDMDLPCPVERYTIAYPEQQLIGDTSFYIDGRYKAVYIHKENAHKTIHEIFTDQNIQDEFRLLINIIENCDRPEILQNEKSDFLPYIYNIYASEALSGVENTILEILGSFAEKCQDISRTIYKTRSLEHPLKTAQKNGLLPSADDFLDYINIRNLMRHQWDTLNELGAFNATLAEKNAQMRATFLQSYLKVCNVPFRQRVQNYVRILDQVQFVIGKIYPDILIRHSGESNSKFIARLKEYQAENPEKPIKTVVNYPLRNDKRKSLNRNLHKLFPDIQILDEYEVQEEKFANLESGYRERAWFLRIYHSLECKAMTYCLTRGKNLKKRAVWDYLLHQHMISSQEHQKWQEFIQLRNDLSHNHYNADLQQKLSETKETFYQHCIQLEDTIDGVFPEMTRLEKNVYLCSHPNGQKITLNFDTHEILNAAASRYSGQTEQNHRSKKTKNTIETFNNNLEIASRNNAVVSLRLPSGVVIDLEAQKIIWPNGIKWLSKSQEFNVLQTPNHKLFTDKKLIATQYIERNRIQEIHAGDNYVLEYKHQIKFDKNFRLQSFLFKKDDGQKIETQFEYSPSQIRLHFSDGTLLSFVDRNISISHNNQLLTYDNRKNFAASYGEGGLSASTFIHKGRIY